MGEIYFLPKSPREIPRSRNFKKLPRLLLFLANLTIRRAWLVRLASVFISTCIDHMMRSLLVLLPVCLRKRNSVRFLITPFIGFLFIWL